jgi:kynurenine formamidase
MCVPATIETVREARVTRRTVLAGGGAAMLTALLPGVATAQRPEQALRGRARVMDLTHEFRAGFPVYTGDEPARRALFTIPSNGFYAQEWTFGEHSGTHIDAPGHFTEGGRFSGQLSPSELVLPIVVIDVAGRARRDPDTVVTPDDLRRFERRHGRIPHGALVAMSSGWDAKVDDDAAFKGTDPSGTYHFPGFGEEAADFLLEERQVTAIGVDTLSLDHGPSTTFGVHVRWLGADRYGLENLANLRDLPPRGATATVGVIPWEEGSGGPARVLATV